MSSCYSFYPLVTLLDLDASSFEDDTLLDVCTLLPLPVEIGEGQTTFLSALLRLILPGEPWIVLGLLLPEDILSTCSPLGAEKLFDAVGDDVFLDFTTM